MPNVECACTCSATTSKPRIAAVADQLGLSFTSGAGKPRRGALRRVIQELDLPNDQIAMVGDRLFTDVLCGNRLGLYTVPVGLCGRTAIPAPTIWCNGWSRVWLG